jgi:hypothetical protein
LAGAAFSIAAVLSVMVTPVIAAGPTDSKGTSPTEFPGQGVNAEIKFNQAGTKFMENYMGKIEKVFPKLEWIINPPPPNDGQ